jgi:glycosyltransferase involved in cell wall biosynthesis
MNLLFGGNYLAKKNLEILFNGCYCGDDIFDLIVKSQDIPMSYAQEKLEKMIFKGAAFNEINITAISSIPVRAYPGNRILWWKSKVRNINESVKLIHLAFINLLIIKQLIFFLGSFYQTFIWCLKNRNNKNKAMLSYSANPPILLPMLFICKLFRVKSFIIVTEITELRFFDGQSSILRSFLLKIMLKVSTFLHESFDGYILITESMNQMVNKRKSPYFVMEGMVDVTDINIMGESPSTENENTVKKILYTGSLNKEYGFKTLISAFKKMEMQDIELVFCGQGSYSDELIKETEIDNRIKYLGMLPYKDVLQLQKSSDFLINPRPTNNIYTNYSFPSKTLEYLLTETPVISTKLNGIPKEYDNYLIYMEDETEEGVNKFLNHLLKCDYAILKETAIEGKNFILNNKNIEVQTGNLFKFIDKTINL